jgi:hypothetical protein
MRLGRRARMKLCLGQFPFEQRRETLQGCLAKVVGFRYLVKAGNPCIVQAEGEDVFIRIPQRGF